MKTHQVIFDKTLSLLKEYLGERLIVEVEKYDAGDEEIHLTINDTDIWISCDDRELTMGSGFNHRHYNPEYESLKVIAEDLFNLLTQRKRITQYYKGNSCYKIKTEIGIGGSKFKLLSTSSTWFFPFWKPTKEKVSYQDGILDQAIILSEINEIKKYLLIK